MKATISLQPSSSQTVLATRARLRATCEPAALLTTEDAASVERAAARNRNGAREAYCSSV